MAIEFKSFIKGDTVPFDVVLKIDGVVQNLAGMKFFVTMKTDLQLGGPDNVAALQVEHDVPAGPPVLATRITLPSDKTNIAIGKYWMDIQRVVAGVPPDVWTFFKRQIEVVQQVTEDNA